MESQKGSSEEEIEAPNATVPKQLVVELKEIGDDALEIDEDLEDV